MTIHEDRVPGGNAQDERLEREAALDTLFLEQAAGRLRDLALHGDRTLARIGRVLDVGGGPGVASCLLARYFPGAEVVALDVTPGMSARAAMRAHREGLGLRVRAQHVCLPGDLGSLGAADLVWAGDVVGRLGDQQGALDALARVLRPGGVIAVSERGLAPRYLPRDIGMGRPGFQARLEAAEEDWFAQTRAALPGARHTVEDWPAMLARAGLFPTGTHSFLTDLPSPLDAAPREHLYDHLAGARERIGDRLAADDRRILDVLLDRDHEAGILWRPDAFYLAATTVHTARACGLR